MKQSWEEVLANHRSPITIELDDIHSIFDCKASFEKSQVRLNDAVVIFIYVRSNTDVPIKVRNIATCLLTSSGSNHRYLAKTGIEYEIDNKTKAERTLSEFRAEDFILESGQCFKFVLEVNPKQFVENVEIGVGDSIDQQRCNFHNFLPFQITGVEITMGTEKTYAVLTLRKSLNKVNFFQRYDVHSDYLENINVIKTCYVIPT